MNYFKYIVYFLLSVFDSVVNLVFAMIHLYPALDLSGEYLVGCQLSKIEKWDYHRQQQKINSQRESMSTMEQIKESNV